MRLKDRFISILTSLFVSVPLCAFIWVVVNFMLVRTNPTYFIDEVYFLYAVLIFSAIAFISPNLFLKLIGFIFGTNKRFN